MDGRNQIDFLDLPDILFFTFSSFFLIPHNVCFFLLILTTENQNVVKIAKADRTT